MNEFKGGCQLRNNLMKDENGDLLTDYHNILISERTLLSAVECTKSQ
jgi:hypothetical protein